MPETASRDRALLKHLPLIRWVAARFPVADRTVADRVQDAVAYILERWPTYKPSRMPLPAWIAFMAHAGIIDAVRRTGSGVVRVRRSAVAMAGCAVCSGSRELWSGPGAEECAKRHQRATGHEIWTLKGRKPGHVAVGSLDAPLSEDSPRTLAELLPAPNGRDEVADRDEAAWLLSWLPRQERRVMELCAQMTQREAGDVLHLTESRISQMRKSALRRWNFLRV